MCSYSWISTAYEINEDALILADHAKDLFKGKSVVKVINVLIKNLTILL